MPLWSVRIALVPDQHSSQTVKDRVWSARQRMLAQKKTGLPSVLSFAWLLFRTTKREWARHLSILACVQAEQQRRRWSERLAVNHGEVAHSIRLANANTANLRHQLAPEKTVLLTAFIQVWFHHENKHHYHLKYSHRKHWSPRWTGLPYI